MASIDTLLVGQSGPMREIKKLIALAAPSATTILIQGETGTGKELAARAIHDLSGRTGQLISVNCSAIPSELLESELFGHEKGAFTGAEKMRAGRFELASGGTLFLDEIGDMPLSLQAKLLRALENRTIQRVGGSTDIEVDFRLVCATHQNIEADIDSGKFRADLFYRINVFPVSMPALASRAVDIPALIEAMLKKIASDNKGLELPQFDQSAFDELMRYPWPGNVRELRNVIERACLLYPARLVEHTDIRNNLLRIKVPDPVEEQEALWAASSDLNPVDVDISLAADNPPLPHPSHYQDWFSFFDSIDLRRHLQDVEIVLIEAALKKSDGMISSAADALKLRRTTLIEKMKKFMIEKNA